jgi:hypothetical protein
MMETTLRQNLVAGALSPADARAIAKEASASYPDVIASRKGKL